jgi:hypothetical protein
MLTVNARIPVLGAAILFFILTRRHARKQREEDANDRHASMDFGLGDVPQNRPKKAPVMSENVGMDEKEFGSRRQVSMDLGVNSPYLLPPELQNSRESLHSLSRTIHQNEDPYRPVTQYYQGDGHSMNSLKNGSSIYTASSAAPSRMQEVSKAIPPAFVPPPRQNSLPQSNASMSPVDNMPPAPPYPGNSEQPQQPEPVHLQQPTIPEITRKDVPNSHLPASPRPGQNLAPSSVTPDATRGSVASNSNNYLGALIDSTPAPAPQSTLTKPQTSTTLPSSPRPPRQNSIPVPPADDEYGDGFKVTPPSPGREETMRGQRYSMDVPPEEFAQAGLGAPGFDPKRLSMGFRPLPPDVVTDVDDPELRANRIRSFYKEYFDESKPEPAGQYYEDYDENYLGDAAYFDPESNAFVMPYAEPVSRQAMTPPPGGPRAGPGGPRFMGPRPRNGSMGAMSVGGVPRGRGPPPGSRAFSSASGRMGPPGQKPKKQLPPPQALTTLPTPSKLAENAFDLMNPMDFAPPTTIRDRQHGRSQSPFGERKVFSPSTPVFNPTVSAFDELAPMPSPYVLSSFQIIFHFTNSTFRHLLRKSGTFTGLDFAPPKRIRDPDTMSDAGSIRSNRSGISQAQLSAIRNGAYRASRIPKEAVFSKDDMASQLKPQWGMRAGH